MRLRAFYSCDVLYLEVFGLGRFEAWDVLYLEPFVAGTLCLWTFCLGTFFLGTFCRCIASIFFNGHFHELVHVHSNARSLNASKA